MSKPLFQSINELNYALRNLKLTIIKSLPSFETLAIIALILFILFGASLSFTEYYTNHWLAGYLK